MAAKKKKATRKIAKKSVQLVVSEDKQPLVALKKGMKLEVVEVSLVDTQLKPKRMPARLCGGTSTCLALTLTEDGELVR